MPASDLRTKPRILLYSHDTFGLGHLRRSRAIAIALSSALPEASVVIVSGSPIIGRYDFPAGVDFVRMPGVVKLPSGEYATHNLNIDIAETAEMRRDLISVTAHSFKPDLVIIDKEPNGFRGEILPMLEERKAAGAKIILGLRDVLDEPEALVNEWARKDALAALEEFYDHIWIYGCREVYEPLKGLAISEKAQARIHYTGYLRRETPDWPDPVVPPWRPAPFVMITAGGGGDGDWLFDWALSAYESDPSLHTHAELVFGPFMIPERRREFERRAARFASVNVRAFDARMERLMSDAAGVVAMGGYNTFCELLSFDKPALIAPRVTPRLEQYIRAEAAQKLGLFGMLPTLEAEKSGYYDPAIMANAIRDLPAMAPPSAVAAPGLLDGLDNVVRLSREALGLDPAMEAAE